MWADDKIIAVLKGDNVYGGWKDMKDVPPQLIDRLRHYFLTYKAMPDSPPRWRWPRTYGKVPRPSDRPRSPSRLRTSSAS